MSLPRMGARLPDVDVTDDLSCLLDIKEIVHDASKGGRGAESQMPGPSLNPGPAEDRHHPGSGTLARTVAPSRDERMITTTIRN